jgi:hypothetical protein
MGPSRQLTYAARCQSGSFEADSLSVKLSPTTKVRLRLLAVAVALVPVAILARIIASEGLLLWVQKQLGRAESGRPPPESLPPDGGAG